MTRSSHPAMDAMVFEGEPGRLRRRGRAALRARATSRPVTSLAQSDRAVKNTLIALIGLVVCAVAAAAHARNRVYPPPPAEPFAAVVTAVFDGDTLVATGASGGAVTVRVAGIDAPESRQANGSASRAHLAAFVCGRTATISASKVDPFGRLVAVVEVDGIDAGLRQLRAGQAWHFARYAHEQPPAQRLAYQQAQALAQAKGIGLWADPAPEAPWDYRQRQRRARDADPVQGAARSRMAC